MYCSKGSLIVEYELEIEDSTESANEAMLAMLSLALGTAQIEILGQNVSATSMSIDGYIGIFINTKSFINIR